MLVNISQNRIDEEKLIKEVQGFEIEHNIDVFSGYSWEKSLQR